MAITGVVAMRGRIAVFALTFLLAAGPVLLLGSGGASAQARPAATTPSPCTSHGTLVCITSHDSGRSVRVRVGDTVRLVLGDSSLNWSTPRQIGPQLLTQIGPAVRGTTDYRETFTASKAGRTDLQASAAPKCTRDEACPQFVLLWRTEIIVSA